MKIKQSLYGLLLFVVLCDVFIMQIDAIWPFTVDDMYIPLRYAKHWFQGNGILWNVGEPPVEGYSNFSMVLLARLAMSWGYDPVLVLKSAGVVGLLGTSIALYAITRFWFVAHLAMIPCLWLLVYKGQIVWATSGLETTVYEALIAGGVYYLFRGLGYLHYPLANTQAQPFFFAVAALLFAFAGMTRPEAPALVLLFAGLLMAERGSVSVNAARAPLLIFCVTFLLCFAPYFLWRWHYYGRLFPNPVYCKGLLNDHTHRFVLDKNYLSLIWPFTLLAFPAIVCSKDHRHYYLWLPSVLYLVLLWGADPIVAFDNRLFLPAFVLLLPLALVGIGQILTLIFQVQDVRFDVAVTVCALSVMCLCIPMNSLDAYVYFTKNPVGGARLRHEVLQWLEHHTRPGNHVVLGDCGLIPYQSDRLFIDSYCLNNAEMTQKHSTLMYQTFCDKVLSHQPEVIVLASMIKDGQAYYGGGDDCLSQKLPEHPGYIKEAILEAVLVDHRYRYEIFKAVPR